MQQAAGKNSRLHNSADMMVMLIRKANLLKNTMVPSHNGIPAKLVVFAPARIDTPSSRRACLVRAVRVPVAFTYASAARK